MTDLEILQRAAKNAGYSINWDEPVNGYYPHGYDDNGDVDAWWNPFKSDGDCFRLMFHRHVDVTIALGTLAFKEGMPGNDPCLRLAFARRAITLAAAGER